MGNQNTVIFDQQTKDELMNMFAMAAMQGTLTSSSLFDPGLAVARASALIKELEAFHTAELAKLKAEAEAHENAQMAKQTVDKVASLYPAPVDAPHTPGSSIEYVGEEPDSV